MVQFENIYKNIAIFIGGAIGWILAEFQPAFPLIIVATCFILADSYTAFRLDKRVHQRYPERFQGEKAKFTSYKFSHTLTDTLPVRLILVILAFLADRYIFPMYDWHLQNFITGAIAFEQLWSMCENESSCRSEEEGRIWKMLQKIMVDKTSRHLDTELTNYNEIRKKNETDS